MTIQRRSFLGLGAAGVTGLAAGLPLPALARAAGAPRTATERIHLSGKDRDQPVDWQFMVTSGRRSGTWSTIPTPSNWECHGFGSYQWGWNLVPQEKGHYRHTFTRAGHYRSGDSPVAMDDQ